MITMNNEVENKIYYATLFAYYGKLLTKKQQEIFCAYYDEDYSLTEIADSLGVSRNAVWDTLKKVSKTLDEYESILKLVEKDKNLQNILQELKKYTNNDGLKLIEKLEKMED